MAASESSFVSNLTPRARALRALAIGSPAAAAAAAAEKEKNARADSPASVAGGDAETRAAADPAATRAAADPAATNPPFPARSPDGLAGEFVRSADRPDRASSPGSRDRSGTPPRRKTLVGVALPGMAEAAAARRARARGGRASSPGRASPGLGTAASPGRASPGMTIPEDAALDVSALDAPSPSSPAPGTPPSPASPARESASRSGAHRARAEAAARRAAAGSPPTGDAAGDGAATSPKNTSTGGLRKTSSRTNPATPSGRAGFSRLTTFLLPVSPRGAAAGTGTGGRGRGRGRWRGVVPVPGDVPGGGSIPRAPAAAPRGARVAGGARHRHVRFARARRGARVLPVASETRAGPRGLAPEAHAPREPEQARLSDGEAFETSVGDVSSTSVSRGRTEPRGLEKNLLKIFDIKKYGTAPSLARPRRLSPLPTAPDSEEDRRTLFKSADVRTPVS